MAYNLKSLDLSLLYLRSIYIYILYMSGDIGAQKSGNDAINRSYILYI